MTKLDFYDILGDIGDKYIEEADKQAAESAEAAVTDTTETAGCPQAVPALHRTKRVKLITGVLSAAAALCIAVTAFAGILARQGMDFISVDGQKALCGYDHTVTSIIPIRSPNPKEIPYDIMLNPEPGAVIYSDNVRAALDKCDSDELILLVLNLSIGGGEISRNDLMAEYRRLSEAGFDFYGIEYIRRTMPGADEKRTVVTVLTTSEQLENFPASPDYGYAFAFPSGDIDEDDISPLDLD